MARSEDIRQIAEGVYREKRAYLADHVFLMVPGAGQPTIDLLSGEQWGTLTDLRTDARSISKY
jgi:hypothetical protein